MVNKFLNLALFCLIFLLSGCSVKGPQTDYSGLLQNKPTSILVVMPTNETTEIKATSAVLTNAILPLSEAGYYVLPVTAVNETFKNNGISEANEIHNISTAKLKEIFGADAVLYLNVNKYGSSYKVVRSDTTVSIDAKLVDLNNGMTLWQKSATATSNSGNGGGNLLVMLVSAVIEQIVSTVSDKGYDVANIADILLLGQNCNDCLLYGPLSPNYGKDSQLQK